MREPMLGDRDYESVNDYQVRRIVEGVTSTINCLTGSLTQGGRDALLLEQIAHTLKYGDKQDAPGTLNLIEILFQASGLEHLIIG